MMKILKLLLCCLFVNCGLLHPGVPKEGDFCSPETRYQECVVVSFVSQFVQFPEETKIDLQAKNRAEYFFFRNNQKYSLSIQTENRVKIQNLDSLEFKEYLRRKPPKKKSK